jgi:hypothetical protein
MSIIDPNSDKYSCIEFHLLQWGVEFKEILNQIKYGKCDSYTFYYYMKDFSERISDLAEYTVNGK